MWSDRRNPTRPQPRPDGAVRLVVEQLDCRCLPSVVWPEMSSFTADGSETIVGLQTHPVPVPPPVSDVASGGDVSLPPPPDGFPLQGVPRNVSALPIMLPTPAFDGPLIAVPEGAAANRVVTIDWGDGVITDAVLAPDVAGWLAVRVNRLLDESATYNANVRLTAAGNPTDRLEIPLLVMTPSESPTAALSNSNATGYWPPLPVEVKPSEWLWVSLPVFGPHDQGVPAPLGGTNFTPPAPTPTTPPAESPAPDPEVPPVFAGPQPPAAPPSTPAGPLTSPPRTVTAPVYPPIAPPASQSPFEAGAVRAASSAATPRLPPPIEPDHRPRVPVRSPPVGEKRTADPTPADPPESWDWVVASDFDPLDLTARSSRSEGTTGSDATDHDSPPPPVTANPRGTPDSRDAGSANVWVPPPEADHPFDPPGPAVARQPAPDSAEGSPEAILAALADAPSPDAVFVESSQPDQPSEDRRERWSWQSGVMALAATVWTGAWFLWPRSGQWPRPVDPGSVAVEGPTLTRDQVARPAAGSVEYRAARDGIRGCVSTSPSQPNPCLRQ